MIFLRLVEYCAEALAAAVRENNLNIMLFNEVALGG